LSPGPVTFHAAIRERDRRLEDKVNFISSNSWIDHLQCDACLILRGQRG